MVVSNMIIFLSYSTICGTLIYLARRTRRVIARDWAYFVVGFALFIVACGLTHWMDVVTTWVSAFWIAAGTNILTALLSAYVAFMLIRRVGTISFSINDYADRLASAEQERARLEASLLNAQKLEDWSRLSATVSHEIRNPLQAIQNLQFLIGNTPGVPEGVAQMAAMAEEEAKRVLAISDATLSFFRHAKFPELIDLAAEVESVRFLLAQLIRQKAIAFEIETRGDCTVQAFAGETRQVLLNVIRNACEAIVQQGGHVKVSLTGSADGVGVLVSDEGVGIDAATLPHIFEFGMTTKGSQGNGMGLWTVKHIVDKHHGRVLIASTPGRETRVELWWPRVANLLQVENLVGRPVTA
jgi:signal transduction histidine kinase